MRPRYLVLAAGLALVLGSTLPASGASPPAVAAAEGWSGPVRIGTGQLASPSLMVDEAGRPHVVARGADGIWYLARTGGAWTRTRLTRDRQVDESTTVSAQSPRLTIDPTDGSLRVFYLRRVADGSTPGSPGQVRFVKRTASGWSAPRTVPVGVNGSYAVAVRAGRIAIAFEDWLYDVGTVRFATNVSGSWQTRSLGASKLGGPRAPSIALDAKARPHIAYTQGDGVRYAHATTPAGPLQKEVVNGPPGDLRNTAIGLAGAGRPRVAFWDEPSAFFAWRGPNAWRTKTASAGHDGKVDLAIDGRGRAHVSIAGAGKGLWYATNASGSWASTKLDGHMVTEADVEVGKRDRVSIAFQRQGGVLQTWFTRSK
jgi:hypothetical protein